jgi:predicted restriction endonuclease
VRTRIEADILRRQGRGEFRRGLLDIYNRRCAITGCDAIPTLEAAHIRTYKGSDDDAMRNGILLRADIHTLFDRV